MAPHSSTLAWKIPWMEEPGRLQSMGSLGPILPYGESPDLAGTSYALSRSQDFSSSLQSFLKCAVLSCSNGSLRLAQPLDKAHFS